MIELSTRKFNHIKNHQGPIGNGQQISKFLSFNQKYPNAILRSPNSGIYNCHGLVFGARRTEINDSNEVSKILNEDDYVEIEKTEVLPGDVIIYYNLGDAEHSGIVLEYGFAPFFIHKIVSKWGQLEEYIHPANQCPYNFSDVKYYRITK